MTSNGPAPTKLVGRDRVDAERGDLLAACSLRTVAVTRAPAIVPSWTAAMPTPPARAVHEQPLAEASGPPG